MCGYFSYVGFWFHCSLNPSKSCHENTVSLAYDFFRILRFPQIEQDKQKRINALPALYACGSGAAKTFARHALKALSDVGMDASKVNWKNVEDSAKKESRLEHHQTMHDIAKAILLNSPGRAGVTEAYITVRLAKAKEFDKENPPRKEVEHKKGLDLGR